MHPKMSAKASLFRPHARWLFLLLSCGILAGLATFSAGTSHADLKGPEASDRQVALVVASLLRREHLSKHPLDDEISRRGLENFLKSLDPMKVYFTKADVDEFLAHREELDDMIKRGDISYGYTIFNRFLQRVDERVKLVNDLLSQAHDFTVDENLVTDPDTTRYAENDEEMTSRWRKRIKYDLLVLKIDETTGDKAIEKLKRRYTSFAKRMHQTDNDELLEMFLTAVTTGFDPHTTYMSPGSLENFNIQMKLNLEGIGAALQLEDGITVISKIIPGGAADKHGKANPKEELKPKDQIVSVGQGDDGEMVDVVDMKLNDVVKLIRGKAGTKVRLGVKREGAGKTETFAITRAQVELKDSEARSVIFEEGTKPDGSKFKLGVINLPSFYMDMTGAREGLADFKSTTRDVRKIIDEFKSKGVDAVILDLRANGGGSLTEAINLTGLFIDEGPVVQVKDSDGRVQHYDDLDPGVAWDGPLVVLTSKFSASASEILAGAIQDYNRGIVVGDETTHGKGTVQSLLDLGSQLFRVPDAPNLGALKITMQQFYRPSGDSTQKRGVLSDVVIPSIVNHMDIAEGDLDYAVDFDRVPEAKFNKYTMVSEPTISQLRSKSADRRTKSNDFAKRMKDIERYKEQKEKKVVTLHEEKFLKEREELDKDKEEEKELQEQIEGTDEVVKKDYYFDEIIGITLDYLDLLKENKVAKRN